MDSAAENFANDFDMLKWQVELGVDECIGEVPINRYELEAKPKAKEKTPKPAPVVEAVEAPPVINTTALAAVCPDLDSLRQAIEAFDGCELKQGARNTVFCDGVAAARVMIIGEAPGREEDGIGRPFVGKAGQLLDKMFAAINLSRNAQQPEDAIYITNVLPWRPPQNRDPAPDEIAMMKPFLLRHIELVAPDFIVLMGNPATKTLLDTSTGITRMRGNWADVLGIPALPMFHPAYLLRTPAQKRAAWADLLALKSKLGTR